MPTTTINLTGQALSKVDDTNVTLTLGGTPLTALLKATSITVGWTGTLADARIASAATWNAKESALTFSTGLTRTVNAITIDSTVVTLTGAQALSNKTGLISQWTNDSGYLTSAVTAVTGSGNIASSGGATPNITFTGVLPTANGGTAVNIASAALVLGTASANAGQLTLSNATNAFTQTIRGTNPAASIIYDLPTTAPTLGQVLSATAPAAGVVTLSWATASSGITINSTAITSGTANRILFENSSNQVSESNTNFYFETGLNYGNCIFAPERTGTITTNKSASAFGNRALRSLTSGDGNTAFGARALEGVTTQSNNTAVGVLNGLYSPVQSIFVGYGAGYSTGLDANYSVMITTNPSLNNFGGVSSCILLGYNCGGLTASHQGMLGSKDANGYISDWYFNGVTHTAPYTTALRGTGGSGTNINGANINIYAGLPTGDGSNTASGRNGQINFWTGDVGASGTTARSATEKVRILQEGGLASLNYADGFILQDNAGTPHYWRVQVDSAGVLFTTDLGTTLPN